MPHGKNTDPNVICTGWSDEVRGCGQPIALGVEATWAPAMTDKKVHSACYFKSAAWDRSRARKAAKGNGIPLEDVKLPGIPSENPASPEVVTLTASTPTPGNGANPMQILADGIAPYLPKQDVEVKMPDFDGIIDAKVKHALENHTRTIVIQRDAEEPKKMPGLYHKQYPELMGWLATKRNVFLFDSKELGQLGGPGAGKSTACKQAAEALGLDFSHMSLNMQSAPWLIMGYKTPTGEYLRTEFRERYENGGVFCFEEIAAANGNFLTSLNTGLANGHMAFPDKIVPRNKDCHIIANDNTCGLGANAHHNTRQVLDAATRQRFVFIPWEYDELLERKAAMLENENAGEWVTWVQKVRAYVAASGLKLLATPRTSINGAAAFASAQLKAVYEDKRTFVKQVADRTLFQGIDNDTKAKVLANVPLPRL